MEKILFISAFHPAGCGDIGAGELISGQSLERFLSAGNIVDVVVISPKKQRANSIYQSRCQSYSVFNQTKLKTVLSIISNFKYMSFFAPWFFTRAHSNVIDYINNLIANNDYCSVWLDFPSTLGISASISHNNIIYCAHDVVTQRIRRSITKRWMSPLVALVESQLLKKINQIRVLSSKDSELIRNLHFQGNISIIELGEQKAGHVDNASNINSVVDEFQGKTNLVFFGNMSRSENHWSILWFIVFIFLRLVRKNPMYHLWVLGLSPRLVLRILSKLIPNVHVTGAVDDPTLAFKLADLCIAPLLFGAGVKIKVIQMLDCGAIVLSTPVGAEGIMQNAKLKIVDPKNLYSFLVEYGGE